jgi:hypothetical protein
MPWSVKVTPNNRSASTAILRRVHNFPPRSRSSGVWSMMASTSASVSEGDSLVCSQERRPGRPESNPDAPPSDHRVLQAATEPRETPKTRTASAIDIPSPTAAITRFRSASCWGGESLRMSTLRSSPHQHHVMLNQ